MSQTVIGLFDEFSQAEAAVRELETMGVPQSSISVVANNSNNQYTTWRDTEGKNYGTPPAGHGANVGATAGGIGGILLGLGLLAIPGLGPLAAAGPLVAGLTGAGVGAGVGAATGGLLGALTDMGVPEEHAGYFAEGIRRGGTLVTVSAADNMVQSVIDVLNRNGAVDINQRASYYQQSGYTGFHENLQPFGATELAAERERVRAATIAAAPITTDHATANRDVAEVNRVNAQGETVLPVMEESIALGKRQVQSGGVRVYTRITETPVQESINLREEHVTVERRPVDRAINASDMTAFKEGVIEVTETAEVPVVAKEARIVEEVVVGKEATQRTETVHDTVRRTDVEVEQLAGTTTTTGTTFGGTTTAGHTARDMAATASGVTQSVGRQHSRRPNGRSCG